MSQAWLRILPPFIRAKIEYRYNLQKIISNVTWLAADKILRMGVGLAVGIWVARYLGPEQFGLFSYALAFVAMFAPLATLGLDQMVIRDLVRESAARNEILGTAFILKLIGGLLIVPLTVSITFFLRPDDYLAIWLIGVIAAGFIFQAFDIIDFWFQSQVQAKYVVWARGVAFLIVALVRVILIIWQAPLIAFAWASLIDVVLGISGLVLVYQATGQKLLTWRGSFRRSKQLLGHSWPLILSSLSIAIYMKIDQIMLGEMVGDDAVGIYAAATRISEIWYFIPAAVVSSVFPSIVQTKSVNENLYYQKLQQLFNLMTGLSLLIAIPMTFLSERLVVLLYGENYTAAGPILAIHIWAALFVFLGGAQLPWDITEGLMILSLQRTFMGAIINVGLNLILIPHYTGLGAAVATVISYAFSAFILNAFNEKTRGIFVAQTKSFLFLRQLIRAGNGKFI